MNVYWQCFKSIYAFELTISSLLQKEKKKKYHDGDNHSKS